MRELEYCIWLQREELGNTVPSRTLRSHTRTLFAIHRHFTSGARKQGSSKQNMQLMTPRHSLQTAHGCMGTGHIG